MPDLAKLRTALDGEVFTPDSPGYDAIRRPVHRAYQQVRPRLVVRCRSVSDVVAVVGYASATGDRVAPRGGGHCFAGRSSTDGIVLDLSGLDGISVADDGIATIGAGARLGQVYPALHRHGRTLPAGCGPTVGIAGLTLGGGIGLLGRAHGLTCDHLVGARVVLADGSVVDTDHDPELLWALRGAGGGQFGVVTSLRFATVPGPVTTRIQADVPIDLVGAWQHWAPDAPDGLTVNLTLVSEPGAPVRAVLFGAATYDEDRTRDLLREFTGQPVELRGGLPVHELKTSFDDLPEIDGRTGRSSSPTRCPTTPSRRCRPSSVGAAGSSRSPRWAAPTTGSRGTPPRSRTGTRGSSSSTPATTRGSAVPGRPPTPRGRAGSTRTSPIPHSTTGPRRTTATTTPG